uniref:Uncharacterized protein n=1 Tax=Noctiluca scintillans TaxID=2966 RepID=A0A7S1ATK8_NOCSC|mmetsp:Transcript_58548/g.155873  ORF Transcript_58548/g.155873 Transcript_58548/m.155873 type:complete len:941 (+) Transcript_58548:82-2904(+)
MHINNLITVSLFCCFVTSDSAAEECYMQCVDENALDTVSINLMAVDGTDGVHLNQYNWIVRKIADFRNVMPHITITVVSVDIKFMASEALHDLVDGANFYHAYVMPVGQKMGSLSEYLLDLGNKSLPDISGTENVEFDFGSLGKYMRQYNAKHDKKVMMLPLSTKFHSLYYRKDVFEMYNVSVPRTLQEYVEASWFFQGKDMNNDGEPDYGSCFPHRGVDSEHNFWDWVAPYVQSLGTSQGMFFDIDTFEPLIDNVAVREALQLWRNVSGPPETGSSSADDSNGDSSVVWDLWASGRCAMTLTDGTGFTDLFTASSHEYISSTISPGSESVWWRETNELLPCNETVCPYARTYPDGKVVNHAPYHTQNNLAGAINGEIDGDRQDAAYMFLQWIMRADNKEDGVLDRNTWESPSGDAVGMSFVNPTLLDSSIWLEYGWKDPATAEYCQNEKDMMDHPNVAMDLRVPDNDEYFAAVSQVLTFYFLDNSSHESDEETTRNATQWMKLAMEAVTEEGDFQEAIDAYQKQLGVYIAPPDNSGGDDGSILTDFAVYVIVGTLGGLISLTLLVLFIGWVIRIYRQKQKFKRRQEKAWESQIDEAEINGTVLGCPMSVILATDFMALGRLVHFEVLRDTGRLKTLDSIQQVKKIQEDFIILFLSHQWLGWGIPDPKNTHFDAMCATILEAAKLFSGGQGRMDLRKIYVWVDYCSIAQEQRPMQELAIRSLPLYSSISDMFIVVAPQAEHDNSKKNCDIDTYATRGWCRAEMMAKVFGSGLDNMFLCEAVGAALKPVTMDMLDQLDLRVFEGDFSCCMLKHKNTSKCDRESLVSPMLGIYSNCLKRDTADVKHEGMFTLETFQKDKERMFPRNFDFEKQHAKSFTLDRRELFGPLPEMMEHRVASNKAKAPKPVHSGLERAAVIEDHPIEVETNQCEVPEEQWESPFDI